MFLFFFFPVLNVLFQQKIVTLVKLKHWGGGGKKRLHSMSTKIQEKYKLFHGIY